VEDSDRAGASMSSKSIDAALSARYASSIEQKTNELLKNVLVGLSTIPAYDDSVLKSIIANPESSDAHNRFQGGGAKPQNNEDKAVIFLCVSKALFAVK
jgi:hypothetical protein